VTVSTTLVADALAGLGRLYPWPVEPSDDLDRALDAVAADVAPAAVVRGGWGVAVVVSLIGLPALAFAVGPVVAVPLAAALGLAAAHAVHAAPLALAALSRTRALGDAPALVGRAVLRMRVEPTAERAAAFAARTGRGPLAERLAEHVRRARGTSRTGLDSFATEWADEFPALERAAGLVEAAAAAPPGERERTLDRALAAVLDGTRERVASFSAAVRGPATAVYAFGVLLPVALVGLLPAARVSGIRVGVGAFVAVYDVLLPVALLGACAWLLVRRPVAFPPPAVDRSHPDVPDRRLVAVAGGTLAALLASLLAGRVVAPWAGAVAAAGVGPGVALLVRHRPVETVRSRVEAVEADLDDALYLVGRRVAEGRAVEAALAAAAAEVSGETGDLLADAVEGTRRTRAGLDEAFLGEHGALAELPSPRARGAAALLALAAREGWPAGDALVALADHLGELRELEREARRELAALTGTLRNTGTVFAPVVAGATVALADGIRETGASGLEAAPPLPTAALGPAVGAYVLLLSVALTALATGLERGLDRSLLAYRVGVVLPTAALSYLAAFVASGLLL
jgi:hypothetical protein